jgi:phosphatidylglycerol---prolipoprotein diacylglyceryl transferase
MQFPINLIIFDREISTHLVMELLSIFLGVRYYVYIRKHSIDTINDLNRLKIFVAVCFGALLGSRFVGVMEDPTSFFNSSQKVMYVFSNKTIVGGLLFALFSVELVKKIIGVTASSGDLMTYPLLFSLIIGRIGCFCEGLSDNTIGNETSLFTGINFGDGILRHPLPLYEIGFLAILWLIIYLLKNKVGLIDGAVFKFFLINYFAYRFFIEFLKDNKFTFIGLSTIQLTCLIGLMYYLKTIFNPKKLLEKYA